MNPGITLLSQLLFLAHKSIDFLAHKSIDLAEPLDVSDEEYALIQNINPGNAIVYDDIDELNSYMKFVTQCRIEEVQSTERAAEIPIFYQNIDYFDKGTDSAERWMRFFPAGSDHVNWYKQFLTGNRNEARAARAANFGGIRHVNRNEMSVLKKVYQLATERVTLLAEKVFEKDDLVIL